MTKPIDYAELRLIARGILDDDSGDVTEEVHDLASAIVSLLDDADAIRRSLPNLMKVSPNDLAAVVDENTALRERDAKLVEWVKSIVKTEIVDEATGQRGVSFGNINVWHCTWCSETGIATDSVHSDARAHDRQCKSHPAVVEAEKLRDRLAEFERMAAGHA